MGVTWIIWTALCWAVIAHGLSCDDPRIDACNASLTIPELCDVGTFADAVGASACLLCDVGTFADAVGASACTTCPFGVVQNATGATNSAYCASWVVVQIVMPYINMTRSQEAQLVALILGALPDSRGMTVEIVHVQGRRLLSPTTIIRITCTLAEAEMSTSTITLPWFYTTLNNTDVPISSAILSTGTELFGAPQTLTSSPLTSTPPSTESTPPLPSTPPSASPSRGMAGLGAHWRVGGGVGAGGTRG